MVLKSAILAAAVAAFSFSAPYQVANAFGGKPADNLTNAKSPWGEEWDKFDKSTKPNDTKKAKDERNKKISSWGWGDYDKNVGKKPKNKMPSAEPLSVACKEYPCEVQDPNDNLGKPKNEEPPQLVGGDKSKKPVKQPRWGMPTPGYKPGLPKGLFKGIPGIKPAGPTLGYNRLAVPKVR